MRCGLAALVIAVASGGVAQADEQSSRAVLQRIGFEGVWKVYCPSYKDSPENTVALPARGPPTMTGIFYGQDWRVVDKIDDARIDPRAPDRLRLRMHAVQPVAGGLARTWTVQTILLGNNSWRPMDGIIEYEGFGKRSIISTIKDGVAYRSGAPPSPTKTFIRCTK